MIPTPKITINIGGLTINIYAHSDMNRPTIRITHNNVEIFNVESTSYSWQLLGTITAVPGDSYVIYPTAPYFYNWWGGTTQGGNDLFNSTSTTPKTLIATSSTSWYFDINEDD